MFPKSELENQGVGQPCPQLRGFQARPFGTRGFCCPPATEVSSASVLLACLLPYDMSQSRRGWGGWHRGFLPGQPAPPRRGTGAQGEAARPGTCQRPEAESADCSPREGLAPFIQAPEQRTRRLPVTLVTPSVRSEAWRRFPFLGSDPTSTFAMSGMHIPAFPDTGRAEVAGGPQANERKRKTDLSGCR